MINSAARLEGRCAVVLGVGSSIGRACAVRFAHEGAQVLAIDPDEANAADVAAAIHSTGGWAASHGASLTSESDAETVSRRCGELWGRLDVLVNCSAAMDFWSTPDDDNIVNWEEVFRSNVLGPVCYTKRLLPWLRHSGSGSIVYLGSIDGIRGNPNYPAYSASKGGLVPLTHVQAWKFAPHNIRVNCIAAAAIDQSGSDARPRFPKAGETTLRDCLQLTPLARRATAEDIASVALFFASNESEYVTGAVLPVDGGRTAITPGTGHDDSLPE